MFEGCHANFVGIHQTRGEIGFVFCGIHADFLFYPYSNQVNVTACLKEVYPLRFQVMGSTFSKQFLFNEIIISKPNLQAIDIHNITCCHTLVSTFRITAGKIQVLVMDVQMVVGLLLLFDGPGILSKRITMPRKQAYIRLGTYQCVLQVIEEVATYSSQKIKYTGKTLIDKVIQTKTSKLISIHYPADICSSLYCVICLNSHKNSILNITLWNISYTGSQNRDCNFGGISIFDFLEEVFIFCENGIHPEIADLLWHRIFYTKSSSGFLVIYSYKEYSALTCHFTISASNCELVKLATCGEHQVKAVGMEILSLDFTFVQTIDPTKCTVFQVSSGLHDKNKMLSLEMNHTYMRVSGGFILPFCKALELKFDHTKFEEKAAHFKVKSFFQKHDKDSKIHLTNFEKENKAFRGKITAIDFCPGIGKMSVNFSLVKRGTFDFLLRHMSEKARCHAVFSPSYDIKTSMTVYTIYFQYLTSNWVVFVANKSTSHFKTSANFPRIVFAFFSMELRFKSQNLVISDTSDKVLRVISKSNHRDVLSHLIYYEALAKLLKIKQTKQFGNVPAIHHKIYPMQKLWRSYQYLLQWNLKDHINIAIGGSVSSLMLQIDVAPDKYQVNQLSKHNQKLSYHWIHLQMNSQLKTTFWTEQLNSMSVFVAKKGKCIFCVPFQGTMGYHRGTISWLNAFSFCARSGSSLPIFFSRESLDEFLFMLKESSDLLTITSMFIDLRVKFPQMM